MDDFLKNLSKSLKSGEQNDDIVKHLKEIDEKADNMTIEEASESFDKRLEEVGKIPDMTEEEREKAEEEYSNVLAEQKEIDERLAMLASIESRNVEIKKLKFEFEEKLEKLKKNYSKIMNDIQEEKIILMGEFKKKYGTEASDEYDFGLEPNTDLD